MVIYGKTYSTAQQLQSWTKLVEINAKCMHISPFSCTKTRTRSRKCFLSPLPSLNVDLRFRRLYRLLFRSQNNIDKRERGYLKSMHDFSWSKLQLNEKCFNSFDHDCSLPCLYGIPSSHPAHSGFFSYLIIPLPKIFQCRILM